MGNLSIWHWLVVLVIWLTFLWPLGRVLRRTGHHGIYALLSLIPIVNWIALWIWAYKKWPGDPRAE